MAKQATAIVEANTTDQWAAIFGDNNKTYLAAAQREGYEGNKLVSSGTKALAQAQHTYAHATMLLCSTGVNDTMMHGGANSALMKVAKSPQATTKLRMAVTKAFIGDRPVKADKQSDDDYKSKLDEWNARRAMIVKGVDFALSLHAAGIQPSAYDAKLKSYFVPLSFYMHGLKDLPSGAHLASDKLTVVPTFRGKSLLPIMNDKGELSTRQVSTTMDDFTRIIKDKEGILKSGVAPGRGRKAAKKAPAKGKTTTTGLTVHQLADALHKRLVTEYRDINTFTDAKAGEKTVSVLGALTHLLNRMMQARQNNMPKMQAAENNSNAKRASTAQAQPAA